MHRIGICKLHILTFNLLLVHGFHMVVVTRSYARSAKIYLSQGLRDYFSELIQSLATNECLEQMF